MCDTRSLDKDLERGHRDNILPLEPLPSDLFEEGDYDDDV